MIKRVHVSSAPRLPLALQAARGELPACLACSAAFATCKGQIPSHIWDSPLAWPETGMGVLPWVPQGHLAWQATPPGTQPSSCPGREGTASILWQFYPVAKQLGPRDTNTVKTNCPEGKRLCCSGRALAALDLVSSSPRLDRALTVSWGSVRASPWTGARVFSPGASAGEVQEELLLLPEGRQPMPACWRLRALAWLLQPLQLWPYRAVLRTAGAREQSHIQVSSPALRGPAFCFSWWISVSWQVFSLSDQQIILLNIYTLPARSWASQRSILFQCKQSGSSIESWEDPYHHTTVSHMPVVSAETGDLGSKPLSNSNNI